MKIYFGRANTLIDQISSILDYKEPPEYREFYTFDI